MENKIKQLQVESKDKFKHFFEKSYKIKAAAVIPGKSKLIYNNPSLDFT